MVPAQPASIQRRNSSPRASGSAGPMATASNPRASARAFTDSASVAVTIMTSAP